MGTSLWPSESTMKPSRFSCGYTSGGKCSDFLPASFSCVCSLSLAFVFFLTFYQHQLVSVSFLLPVSIYRLCCLSAARGIQETESETQGAVAKPCKTSPFVCFQQSSWDDRLCLQASALGIHLVYLCCQLPGLATGQATRKQGSPLPLPLQLLADLFPSISGSQPAYKLWKTPESFCWCSYQ